MPRISPLLRPDIKHGGKTYRPRRRYAAEVAESERSIARKTKSYYFAGVAHVVVETSTEDLISDRWPRAAETAA